MKVIRSLLGMKESPSTEIPLVVHDGSIKYYSNLQQPEKKKTTNFDSVGNEEKSKLWFTLPSLELLQISNKQERILLFVGAMLACLSGTVWPTTLVLDGYLLQNFVQEKMGVLDYLDCPERDNDTNITREFHQELYEKANRLCLGLLVVTFFHFCFNYGMMLTLKVMAESQAFHIRQKLWKSVLRQDMCWFDSKSAVDFKKIMISDPLNIERGFGEKFGMMIQTYSLIFISFCVSIYHGWKLTLVLVTCITITMTSRVLVERIQQHLEEFGIHIGTQSKAEEIAAEVFENIQTIVAFGGEKKEIERYEQCLDRHQRESNRKAVLFGAGSLLFCLCYFSTLTLSLWYGLSMAFESHCNYSGFQPKDLFIVFSSLWLVFTMPRRNRHYYEEFCVARASAKNIFDVLYREPYIDSCNNRGMKPSQVKGRITFKDVYFAYPHHQDNMILKGVTLDILPGETVAIIDTGGFETVFVDLLERFYDPLVGQVKIDGKDLRQINIGWLRDNLAFVGPEAVFLQNSIMENIRSNNMKSLFKDVERVSKIVLAHDFIVSLSDKYNRMMDTEGSQMTAIEKWKISFARALLKNPKIFLFHIPSTLFDLKTEIEIMSMTKQLMKGRTALFLGRQLSVRRNVDRIIVLDQGQIKETGNHEELMANMGLYYSMFRNESLSDLPEKQCTSTEIQEIQRSPTKPKTTKEGRLKMTNYRKEWQHPIWQLITIDDSDWPYVMISGLLVVFIGSALSSMWIIIGNVLKCLTREEHDFESGCYSIVLFFIIGFIISSACLLKNYLFILAEDRMTIRLRKSMFSKIIKQDADFFEKTDTTALCSRLSVDTESIHEACLYRLTLVVQSASTILTAFVISLCYNGTYGIVLDAVTPLILASAYLQEKARNEEIFPLDETYDQLAVEVLKKMRCVASLRYENSISQQYVASIGNPRMWSKKLHLFGILIGSSHSLYLLFNALAMYYGNNLIYEEEMEYQDLFKVLLSIAYAAWIGSKLLCYSPEYVTARKKAVAITKLLQREIKTENFLTDGLELQNFNGDVEFCNVTLDSEEGELYKKLDGVNLKLKPGQIVGLVGAEDSGKSFCLYLIEKFYEASQGEILMDGITIQDLDARWLRSQIGFVAKKPSLFGYTVAGNIAYGDNTRTVPMSEIVQAAKVVGIHDVIKNLPAGYFSNIDDTTMHLTEGHKKMISLARALIRNPKILLFDYVDFGVERASEKVIAQSIEKACRERTCFIASNHIRCVLNCDFILVFKDGAIVEKGSHEQLMAKQGLYYKLYIMQCDYSK